MRNAIAAKVGHWLFCYGWYKAALEEWLENRRQARRADPTLIRKDVELLIKVIGLLLVLVFGVLALVK